MLPQPYVSRVGRFLVIHEESFEGVGLSSNVYAIEHDGKYYLFDSGGHPDLLSYLEVAGIPGTYIGAVFLTHGHYDHVTGIKSLVKFEVPVFISGADRWLMEQSLGPIATREVSEGRQVLGDLQLEALATPGHTRGSVCYHSSSESLLISGDTVFADGFFGRTDLPGGSSRDMLESLKRLSKLGVRALLAGHGSYVTEGGSDQISNALSNASSILRP